MKTISVIVDTEHPIERENLSLPKQFIFPYNENTTVMELFQHAFIKSGMKVVKEETYTLDENGNSVCII